METTVSNTSVEDDGTMETGKPKDVPITLELGDIIEIIAPTNSDIHEITAYITYIDAHKLKIVNVADGTFYQLTATDAGYFTDESIKQINLLSRSAEKGYARQNELLPGIWVDIHFGGEIPAVITGEITNLDEDMIEVTMYPSLKTIYINFGYKGIPENVPIDSIVIRNKPVSPIKDMEPVDESEKETETAVSPAEAAAASTASSPSMQFTETGESIISIPENSPIDVNVRDKLHELYIEANNIVFGERLEPIKRLVEIPESERRYGIDAQVNDLNDELLSTIPNSQRTLTVLSNIQIMIERFKELRQQFSQFDSHNDVYGIKINGTNYKPLVERIYKMDTLLKWIVPVVSQRKKIYGVAADDNATDVVYNTPGEELRAIETLQNRYYDRKNVDATLTYSVLNKRIQSVMMPFENMDNQDQFLSHSEVLTNMDAIIDNLGRFKSSVFDKDNQVEARNFVVQRYNLGLSNIKKETLKSGKTLYIRNAMTPNDEMNVKSLLFLPEPVVKFSTIHLPSTNMMDRVNLHHNYLLMFKLLHKNADIIPHVIDDLSKEIDYEQMEKEDKITLLNGIQSFALDPNMNIERFEQNEKLKQLLDVIIPKTRFLIRFIRKHIKDKISFMEIVKTLEPYMVYSSDINYQHYMEIRFFMKERITEIKKQLLARAKDFDLLRNTKYRVMQYPNTVLKLLDDKKVVSDAFFQSYAFLQDKFNTKLTPQEIIMRMNNLDNSNLYTNLVTSLLISLITPNNFTDALAKQSLDDMTDNEQIKPSDCSRRFLTKKYTSMNALQKDNNAAEIYYDKDFDDTPYDLLKKYKDEQKKKSPADFHEFLTENLIHIHGANKEIASEMATTLIAGKKLVRDGEFALLEQRPTLPENIDEDKLSDKEKKSIQIEADMRQKITYYRRLNDNWIQDDTINDEAFIDTNTLFCNISQQCYKNLTNKTCETNESAGSRFTDYNRQKLLGEFDKRFSVSIEELDEKLTANILLQQQYLNRVNVLADIKLKKANNLAYTIGTLAIHNDAVYSPHIPTRDIIMGETNFPNKQTNICAFVSSYCRNPMVIELQEDANWLYCKETNTKLFPLSIYTLADTFMNTPDKYMSKLDELCKTVGVLSDDGDDIVDKYSGMVLRKREFISGDEYDEAGFRITSHDLIEKDLGTVVMENLGKKEKRVFENETSETIYNVFSTICSNIDINIDPLADFILRVSNEMINVNIMSETAYNKRSAKMEKDKGKALQPYANYRNETMIFIIASVLIVAIQTAIPSFQTKRTFPSCVRSFSGFPMDGIEDTTGIQYIACVINKVKSQISPWNSIKKYKPDILASRIQQILTNHIITLAEISDMYDKKREYKLLNPELVAPEEHRISKWVHFLPPVIDFSVVKTLHTISTDFKKDFVELLKRGHSDQHASIATLKSKIFQYGCGIIESINHVVKTKDLLLKSSTRLFLENACCNETDIANPITYFNQEDDSIRANISIVTSLGKMLQDLNTLTRAPLLYHPEFTGISYSIVSAGSVEDKIYSAVIHYCNFDRDLPVPEIYQSVCSQRPEGYDRNLKLSDKIEFLKKNGKRYTIEDLTKLMSLVYEKNAVAINHPLPFSPVDVLKEIVNKMDDANSNVIDEPLRKHLMAVLNKYNPKTRSNTKSPELASLTRYLSTANKKLLQQLYEFLDKHGNLTGPHLNKITKFLSNIQKWNADVSMTETGQHYEEGFYSALQFIHNAIYHISKVYPAALLTNSSFFKTVPPHWGVHSLHATDLQKFIDKYYEKLEPFKGDATLLRLLREVTLRLTNLDAFMKHIPVHTDIMKEVDETLVSFHSVLDKQTVYMLYAYCLYSAIYEYIICSNDSELEHADIQERKQLRRDTKSIRTNPSNLLHTTETELSDVMEEASDELQEVHIIAGNQLELKQRVSSLIVALLDIEGENKDAIDMSYEQIMKKVNRSKDKEKGRIISYFGNMTIDERKIEDAFKNYKLGRWNVGQQKGLFQYDPKTYERERNEMIAELYDENPDMTDAGVDALDIFELDKLDAVVETDDYNRDTYDFQDLGEEYDDGDYYQEEGDNDGF
jgi:hypothetical protein